MSAAHTTKWYISAPFSFVEGIKPTFRRAFSTWRLLVFPRPLYEFLRLLIFVMGQLVPKAKIISSRFFGSFGTTTVGLLFIVVYLLNHLPGKSFLFLGVSPRFSASMYSPRPQRYMRIQTYSVVSFSRNWLSCLALKSLFPVVKRPL